MPNDRDYTTLRDELLEQLDENNETWDDIQAIEIVIGENFKNHSAVVSPFLPENPCKLLSQFADEEKLDIKFYNSYGTYLPMTITVWTKHYVYFSSDYDGMFSVDVVRRNP